MRRDVRLQRVYAQRLRRVLHARGHGRRTDRARRPEARDGLMRRAPSADARRLLARARCARTDRDAGGAGGDQGGDAGAAEHAGRRRRSAADRRVRVQPRGVDWPAGAREAPAGARWNLCVVARARRLRTRPTRARPRAAGSRRAGPAPAQRGRRDLAHADLERHRAPQRHGAAGTHPRGRRRAARGLLAEAGAALGELLQDGLRPVQPHLLHAHDRSPLHQASGSRAGAPPVPRRPQRGQPGAPRLSARGAPRARAGDTTAADEGLAARRGQRSSQVVHAATGEGELHRLARLVCKECPRVRNRPPASPASQPQTVRGCVRESRGKPPGHARRPPAN
mmetsp:Transcript_57790/g.132732  ORF Transcript_57790/g.132732 Transcript_57790/m.132732 type:complete len:338 (+) Transcript_57790:122-1135(+)